MSWRNIYLLNLFKKAFQANLSLGVLSDIDIIVPQKDINLVKKFESINPIYKKIEQNENEVAV